MRLLIDLITTSFQSELIGICFTQMRSDIAIGAQQIGSFDRELLFMLTVAPQRPDQSLSRVAIVAVDKLVFNMSDSSLDILIGRANELRGSRSLNRWISFLHCRATPPARYCARICARHIGKGVSGRSTEVTSNDTSVHQVFSTGSP